MICDLLYHNPTPPTTLPSIIKIKICYNYPQEDLITNFNFMSNQIDSQSLDSVALSIHILAKQISDMLEQGKSFKLPKNYQKINKIVLSGMGGSNLAGRIFNSVFEADLKAPIIINADYEIPNWVSKDTLFIASSYSGNTEETIASYKEAKRRQAKIVVLTANSANNTLLKLAKRDKVPYLAFTVNHNPSNQPRLALGYAIFSLASILSAAGLVKIKTLSIKLALSKLSKLSDKNLPTQANNPAAKLATEIVGCGFITVVGPFLAGNAHAFRNQLNENSKNRANYLVVPDMNHHALEGLSHPITCKDAVGMLFIESSLYHPRIQKRMTLTKEVAKKNEVKVMSIKLTGQTKLEQSLEFLSLGAWITYYLAELNHVDPIKIPWVDWFKKQLK